MIFRRTNFKNLIKYIQYKCILSLLSSSLFVAAYIYLLCVPGCWAKMRVGGRGSLMFTGSKNIVGSKQNIFFVSHIPQIHHLGTAVHPCVSPLQLQWGKKQSGINFFPEWHFPVNILEPHKSKWLVWSFKNICPFRLWLSVRKFSLGRNLFEKAVKG